MDAFKEFFDIVGIFFVLYMIGYASFLFLDGRHFRAVSNEAAEPAEKRIARGVLCARHHCGACL